MQYSQEHLKTMVYAEFGGQTECIMGNWKIENDLKHKLTVVCTKITVSIRYMYYARQGLGQTSNFPGDKPNLVSCS